MPIEPKNWFSKHMILGYVFLGLVFAGIVGFVYWQGNKGSKGDNEQVCVQVIQKARNPQTGEVKEFPTPCDVPEGWEKVDSEVIVETSDWKTYTFRKSPFKTFEIKYPSDWTVKDDSQVVFQKSEDEKLSEENNKNCSDNKPETTCIPELYVHSVNFYPGLGDIDSSKYKGEQAFSGVVFKKYVDGGLFGDYTTYVTIQDGINYNFSADESSLSYLDRMLSTFKFIE